MNKPDKNNYTWIDIVEPEIIAKTMPAWEYLLIVLTTVIVLFFVIRYFNIHLRFKLWLLNYNLAHSANTKETAKKILALFKLEKNTHYIEATLQVNKESGINCRLELLKACYADTAADRQHILSLLKTVSKWLR